MMKFYYLNEFEEVHLGLFTENGEDTVRVHRHSHSWNMSYGGRDELQFYQMDDLVEYLDFW